MLAAGLLTLIDGSQIGRNIDPDEVLRYFSWTRYAIVAIVYTTIVFWVELAKDGPFIFSRKNARSKLEVVQTHTIFLVVLLFGYRICIEIVPALPFWMTDTFRFLRTSQSSFADIVSCLVALAMAYFERKWLYKEQGIQRGGPENPLPDAPTGDDN